MRKDCNFQQPGLWGQEIAALSAERARSLFLASEQVGGPWADQGLPKNKASLQNFASPPPGGGGSGMADVRS